MQAVADVEAPANVPGEAHFSLEDPCYLSQALGMYPAPLAKNKHIGNQAMGCLLVLQLANR